MFLSVVLPFSWRFWLLAFCFGCFCAEETKTKHEQPKPPREWQYNAEKHKGKASASRVRSIGRKSRKHALLSLYAFTN